MPMTAGDQPQDPHDAAGPPVERDRSRLGAMSRHGNPSTAQQTRILVDADACPVKRIIREEAGPLPVLWFSTVDHEQADAAAWIRVAKGSDAVDHAIFSALRWGDVVVTQDYGLASLCLGRGARAIHPDGRVYTAATMPLLLEERYASARARRAGIRTRGPRPRHTEDDRAFRAALRDLLHAVDAG